MSETRYNIEVKLPLQKRWQYFMQVSKMLSAIQIAKESPKIRIPHSAIYRVRKVVKTIIWKQDESTRKAHA